MGPNAHGCVDGQHGAVEGGQVLFGDASPLDEAGDSDSGRGDLVGAVFAASAVEGHDFQQRGEEQRYVAGGFDREGQEIICEAEADELGGERSE